MKKLFIFALMFMLSMSDLALGKVNPDQAPDEEEIGNFDFIYGTQDDLNEAFEKTEMIMSEAFSHMGARYRSGGKGPSAFDCSGFTSYVYKQQTDLFIGASSRDQYARNIPITRDELQSGDLEGTQQSGMAFDLKIADIARDGQIVQMARDEAQKIIDEDPECNSEKFSMLWNRLRQLRKTNINWAAIS